MKKTLRGESFVRQWSSSGQAAHVWQVSPAQKAFWPACYLCLDCSFKAKRNTVQRALPPRMGPRKPRQANPPQKPTYAHRGIYLSHCLFICWELVDLDAIADQLAHDFTLELVQLVFCNGVSLGNDGDDVHLQNRDSTPTYRTVHAASLGEDGEHASCSNSPVSGTSQHPRSRRPSLGLLLTALLPLNFQAAAMMTLKRSQVQFGNMLFPVLSYSPPHPNWLDRKCCHKLLQAVPKKRKLPSKHFSSMLQQAGLLQVTSSDNSLSWAFARVLLSGTPGWAAVLLLPTGSGSRWSISSHATHRVEAGSNTGTIPPPACPHTLPYTTVLQD